ncbi:MAG: hypothetical protein LC624_03980, partial [Halobacteriales archaeon]|nr:hypothetical protein [Halobacteriales archaeon]
HGTVASNVHQGGICSLGGSCVNDRTLLDYFESDVLPDGRLVVAFPEDPVTDGKSVTLRLAVQEGGSPLVAP